MRMFRSVWPKDQDCTLHDHVFHNFFHGISRVVILASGDKWVLFCYGGLWIRQTPQNDYANFSGIALNFCHSKLKYSLESSFN